ncbi:putative hydrolase [Rosa chinensis]|uniref:Putative hydrolase n=1 Tax=Rosa chinensis TaxID=74649 RepID=A0A2P6R6I7_ROSCH|nr:putative hydrolase [Rosa chinensis]
MNEITQGGRKYVPVEQATAQLVMKDAVSAGSISVFVLGTHTNLAIFLMTNPHLKKNIEHIYVMGGAIEPGIGNLFPPDSNPYAEFNFFGDPFAAYTVLHSGVPITLIPLDATRTIPVNKNFFAAFEQKQDTIFEAQYSFQTLKMVRDTWPNNKFHEEYCFWDSFMVGVALSQMSNLERSDQDHGGENEFAEMEYMNISVVTSNTPYGISDGSNPLISGGLIPKFNLQKNGVHSGHVQLGLQDPFCLVKGGKGKCQDGYTQKATGPEAVSVLVATEAKPNCDIDEKMLTKKFYKSFLEAEIEEGFTKKFWIGTVNGNYGRVELELIKGLELHLVANGILVTPNGWATAATIEILYDILHMMERDDIQVGLGNVFAVGQSYSSVTFTSLGDCSYSKSIPQGSGGSLDYDTLYGFARDLPRSPRRYKPEIRGSPGFGQPTALDVWKSIEVFIVGGHIVDENDNDNARGNVFTVASNEYADFNMFLDPLAAKAVFDSKLNITMIPWKTQKQVSTFFPENSQYIATAANK